MDPKAQHELTVFAEFATAASLPELSDCAESRSPPEPDIFLRSETDPRYFELGRLLDAEYSRNLLKMQRESPRPITFDVKKIKLPEREILAQKLKKAYQANGYPIELLLYFDADAFHLEGGLPPMEFSVHADYVMAPLLRHSMGSFRRVWVFERYRNSVLWVFPPSERPPRILG